MTTKRCGRCKEIKPIDQFGKDKRTKSGLRCECNECRRLESKLYRIKNPEKKKESKKKYYDLNKEKETKRLKHYRETNKDKRRITKLNWVKNNKEKYNLYSSNWKKEKRKTDPIYRLMSNLRSRTKQFLKGKDSSKKTLEVIGCCFEDLKIYLESKFTDGMTWDNYGFYGWHIDHIVPLSSAKTKEDIYKLCHYTNLQPLWCNENLKKGNRIID